jgi:S-DNA-T family DNA segregation ATPase FtsK/SpoIIIE
MAETHNLGNWVVNYDELLDRRQLLNQAVRVIRYKQLSTQGRNVVISSKAPLDLLKSMVLSRIRDLSLGLPSQDESDLADRFIDDANKISGEIVLRAARRGRNASELMGVVLSGFMIRQELGLGRYYGWYFLDDYADWLGQREEQIADILALSPEEGPDGKRLAIVVAEAKYVQAPSFPAKRKESRKQLSDTVRRIHQALFGSPHRLDREIWLSRFSDLVLNGIEFPATAPIDLSAWRRAVRDGECGIYLRGYSHVFVSGPDGTPEVSDFVSLDEPEGCFQEVFSRPKTAELVLRYWKNEQPLKIRQQVAEEATGSSLALQGEPSAELFRKPGAPATAGKPVRPAPKKAEKPKGDEAKGDEGGGTARPPVDTSPKPIPASPVPAQAPTPEPQPSPPTSPSPGWAYPEIAQILEKSQVSTSEGEAETAWLKRTENACRGALQQFQLRSKLLSSSLTPNAALLKFQGSSDLTVEQVLKRRSEFLTTHKLEAISVRAEPGVVAIAIARPNRRILQLPEVWRRWQPSCEQGNYNLLIGIREEDSSLLFLSPRANAPHTLIAGSTGSGKSVLMQNIILGIAATNKPNQAKIVLIDPKLGVDYFAFEGLPHLEGGLIEEQETAIDKLTNLVAEMQRRYAVLKQNKVANIFELNKKADATEHIPFLWIIHDEFADWMMTENYRDAVTDVVGRLGAKARAAGISLVFAAQRPDANVMPMQLRANLGNRLILRVDSEGTSEIALGEKGAERLLGKGHMAAKLEGESSLIYAQVPFVTTETLRKLVTAIGGLQQLGLAYGV